MLCLIYKLFIDIIRSIKISNNCVFMRQNNIHFEVTGGGGGSRASQLQAAARYTAVVYLYIRAAS